MDIVALKYVCRINGLNYMNLTKLDVLSSLDEIKIGLRYRAKDGTILPSVPAELEVLEVEIVLFSQTRRAKGRAAGMVATKSHHTSHSQSSRPCLCRG